MTGLALREAAFLEQAADLLGLPAVHAREELDPLEFGYAAGGRASHLGTPIQCPGVARRPFRIVERARPRQ
jgi:hypothetical protein